MEKPLISAVITAYNCSEYIRDALDSVLAQTLVPDEILVVDDGSTDDIQSIVTSEYAPHVRFIRQENLGAGQARNTGLHNTSGQFLTYLDCDDIWVQDKTERQLAYLHSHPDAVMVSGPKIWWDMGADYKYVMEYPRYSMQKLRREIMIHNIVGNPSMSMLRRQSILQAGAFRTDLRWGQDWECWIRLSAQGDIGFVEQPVVIYRWHTDNVSRKNYLARVDCLKGISLASTKIFQPKVLRPYLRIRAISLSMQRTAEYSRRAGIAPLRRVFLAIAALLLWPGDGFKAKIFTIIRTTFGEKAFQSLKHGIGWVMPEREK